ncbi:BMP family protein, partial [Streptomyces scabiei]
KDLGIEFHDVECRSAKDVEPNITAMAEQNFDLVLAIGINQAKPLENVAAKYPKVNFAIVDGMVKAPNVRALLFSENEGSFLAGYLAGLMT